MQMDFNQSDITRLRNNPHLFKNILKSVAEKVVAEDFVSEHHDSDPSEFNIDLLSLKETVSTTKLYMQGNFQKIVDNQVDEAFEQLGIGESCLQVCKWEEDAENCKAWRPTTGDTSLCPRIAHHLETYKRRLQRKLTCYRNNADDLEKHVISQRSNFKKNVVTLENTIKNATALILEMEQVRAVQYKS